MEKNNKNKDKLNILLSSLAIAISLCTLAVSILMINQLSKIVKTNKEDTIKSISISGKTITCTKGDNTTNTLTTQDTTYSAGSNLSLSNTTFSVSNTPSFTSITIGGYTITID